jgi:arylsulfatase A-like enzyme
VIRLLAHWGIVELLDLFPTFCDFAGLRVASDADCLAVEITTQRGGT